MPKIFISYRRDDSRTITGRIYDRLSAEFGSNNIFRDINAIPLGSDFPSVIEHELASCDFLLAVIGSHWVSITDSQGRKRLDDPTDFVRIEVETALRLQGVTVIPVYVDGVRGLSSADLPPTLVKLPRRNAAFVRDDPDFHSDIDKLIASIKLLSGASESVPSVPMSAVPPPTPTYRSRLPIGIVLVAVLIIAIIGLLVVAPRIFQTAAVPTSTQPPTTIAPSATVQPTVTFTPTTEPAPTPLPRSETPSPTDVPTPIPPSQLPPVSISVPTVVLPDSTILVTAWPNAHCIFTPDDGSIPFGFDTSTGNIQYSVKHKSGTNISVVCEDALGRHVENQLNVNLAEIPAMSYVPTSTNLPPSPTSTSLPTATILVKSYPCEANVIFTNGAMLNQVKVTPQKNAPTRQPVQQGLAVLLMAKQRNDGLDWYQIKYENNTGWIPSEYIIPANTCPT